MHGKLFEKILEKYNLSQIQLAKELNIPPQYVSDIVNDRKKAPRKSWKILTDKYNVNYSYLLNCEGDMFQLKIKVLSIAEYEKGLTDKEKELAKQSAEFNHKFMQDLDYTEKEKDLMFDCLFHDKDICMLFFKKLKENRKAVMQFLMSNQD